MSTLSRWLVVAVFAVASSVAVAVYTLRITAVEVVGAGALSPNDVLVASGLRGGERILWLRMGAVAARIEAFPGVAAVEVQRELPGTVVIRVTERSAAVLLDGTRGLAADASGIVFARRTSSGIPVLGGWRTSARPGAVLDPASRAVVASLHSFPQDFLHRVRRITLFGSVVMVLDDGTEIRFGQPSELPAKARAADAVLAVAAGRKLAYVDVRAPSAPASRDRNQPSPSPSSGPSGAPSPSPQAR